MFGKCKSMSNSWQYKVPPTFGYQKIVVPSSVESIEAGKGNSVVLCCDGKNFIIKVHYH